MTPVAVELNGSRHVLYHARHDAAVPARDLAPDGEQQHRQHEHGREAEEERLGRVHQAAEEPVSIKRRLPSSVLASRPFGSTPLTLPVLAAPHVRSSRSARVPQTTTVRERLPRFGWEYLTALSTHDRMMRRRKKELRLAPTRLMMDSAFLSASLTPLFGSACRVQGSMRQRRVQGSVRWRCVQGSVRQRLATFANVCQWLSTCVKVCRHVSTFVRVCRILSTCVDACQSLSTFFNGGRCRAGPCVRLRTHRKTPRGVHAAELARSRSPHHRAATCSARRVCSPSCRRGRRTR